MHKSGILGAGTESANDEGVVLFYSEKAAEIIAKQEPIDPKVIQRVNASLEKQGGIIVQSEEIDRYLVANGREASTFTDGMIWMHTEVSASGFFEELIHYGQIINGRAEYGNDENELLMEIEAKERLIKNRRAYGITDFEVEMLAEALNSYKIQLDDLRRAGD